MASNDDDWDVPISYALTREALLALERYDEQEKRNNGIEEFNAEKLETQN